MLSRFDGRAALAALFLFAANDPGIGVGSPSQNASENRSPESSRKYPFPIIGFLIGCAIGALWLRKKNRQDYDRDRGHKDRDH